MVFNGRQTPVVPGMTLADQIRVQKQGDLFRKTLCLAGCPEGTDMSTQIPLFFKDGPRNVRVRCLGCLTYYEITPDCKIVNIRHVAEQEGLPETKLLRDRA